MLEAHEVAVLPLRLPVLPVIARNSGISDLPLQDAVVHDFSHDWLLHKKEEHMAPLAPFMIQPRRARYRSQLRLGEA